MIDAFPEIKHIKGIVFDFDGVFTDNKVTVTSSGEESVVCSRSDGLAIDYLKKIKVMLGWDVKVLILSTETNNVVRQRADKLGIDCINAAQNKRELLFEQFPQLVVSGVVDGVIYLGNDLNDYAAMKSVTYSIAPLDAHPKIKEIANMVLPTAGGNGFVRLFIEKLIQEYQINEEELYGVVFNS